MCECVHVNGRGSVSLAPPSPRGCYIHPRARTYKALLPLKSCPRRNIHSTYCFTTACLSVTSGEEWAVELCKVPSLRYERACMRRQLPNRAGQTKHSQHEFWYSFEKRAPCVRVCIPILQASLNKQISSYNQIQPTQSARMHALLRNR